MSRRLAFLSDSDISASGIPDRGWFSLEERAGFIEHGGGLNREWTLSFTPPQRYSRLNVIARASGTSSLALRSIAS